MKWNKKFKYPESTKSIQKSFKAKLPSVSTILKETMSDEKKLAIQKWMERVGNEEAEKIKKDASSRGDKMHIYIDNFLSKRKMLQLEDDKPYKMAQTIIENGIKGHLKEIWSTEAVLYFPEKYVGITDLVGKMDNDLETVIDFKQSNTPKQEKYCEDYFLQLGAYSLAHNTVYNSRITQGVILLCTVDYLFQEFIIEGNQLIEFQNKFLERVEQFYNQ